MISQARRRLTLRRKLTTFAKLADIQVLVIGLTRRSWLLSYGKVASINCARIGNRSSGVQSTVVLWTLRPCCRRRRRRLRRKHLPASQALEKWSVLRALLIEKAMENCLVT